MWHLGKRSSWQFCRASLPVSPFHVPILLLSVALWSGDFAEIRAADAPVISRSHDSISFYANRGPVIVDDGISITGMSAESQLHGVTARISEGFTSGDQLGFIVNGVFSDTYAQNGITGSCASDTGVLTLTGVALIGDYVQALRAVAYRTVSFDPLLPGERRVEFFMADNDGNADLAYDPATSRYYRYIAASVSWGAAAVIAESKTLYGRAGYLATPMSEAENEVIRGLIAGVSGATIWLGAAETRDGQGSRNWTWTVGPEAGALFWNKGHLVPGMYANWDTGLPKSQSGSVLRRLVMKQNGKWDHVNADEQHGYIVEYGGLPGEPYIQLFDSVTVDLHAEAPVSALRSAVSVPEMIKADGVETATLTVTLKDIFGEPFLGTADLTPSVRHGSIIAPLTHVGGGVYTTQVCSTTPGTTRVVVMVNGEEIPNDNVLLFRNLNEDEAPYLELSRPATSLFLEGPPILIDPALEISGMKPVSTLERAQVSFLSGFVASDDALGFWVNGQWRSAWNQGGITSSYNSATGVLTLSGEAAVTEYLTALRAVAYRHSKADPDQPARQVEFRIFMDDGRIVHQDPGSGQEYEYIGAALSWTGAELAAAQQSRHGRQRYLVAITSQAENSLVSGLAETDVWIGGSDLETSETWRWMTGPETGRVFWNGLANGSGPLGTYSRWATGEPNHGQTAYGLERHVRLQPGNQGSWSDVPNVYPGLVSGYIVEYGGLPGDPVVRLADTIMITLVARDRPVAAFSWNPALPRFGETITFIDQSADPEGLLPLSHRWDFGDGSAISEQQHPTHAYTAPGIYQVKLSVTNSGGLSGSVSRSVDVRADLTGYLFGDANRNALWDTGEGGLGSSPGVEVALAQEGIIVARAPDSVRGHTLDGTTGVYRFSRLPVGLYDVMVIRSGGATPVPYTPFGWMYTGAYGGQPFTGITIPGLPGADSGTLRGPNFGFARGWAVRGSVFRDDGGKSGVANDGARQSGEPGIGAMRLRAVAPNGATVGSTLTDSQGDYALIFTHTGDPGDGSPQVRLVLGSDYRPTGYTPGTAGAPVRLGAFADQIDVPIRLVENSVDYPGYDFGIAPAMLMSGTQSGTAPRGAVKVMPFSISTGTKGSLSFTVSSPRGWDYTVYHDKDGDGLLGAQDVQLSGELSPIGPGDVHLLLVVRVPTSEQEGTLDTARVTVTFSYAGNPLLLETSQFYSIISVQSARLDLIVDVRNVTQDMPSGSAFTQTHVEARTGDLLEYKVVYHNRGVSTATDVRVHTAIPRGTRLITDAYGSEQTVLWIHHQGGTTEHPSVSPNGEGFTLELGTVLPGEQGSLTYRVSMD